MNTFERIKKECFWDYKITPEEIKIIAESGTKEEKKKLFQKIMYNSRDKLGHLMIFKKDELREFFNDFVPAYNTMYLRKHMKVLKYLLLKEHEPVQELAWKEK
ncbi:MAG TPA: hypothetical protein PL059_10130 [Spirochaetota bacterium]|nr:hypothetical protein [Spirochaetota bacterium]HOM10448.1 hypothetical protein [Spirochaetota bacterium]HPP50195.1 hypothetical protein [Spirochaetota bacterium]